MIRLAIAACACAPLLGCATDTGPIEGPPPVKAGLPEFRDAPTIYGTLDDPDAFGTGRARIEGNTFYYIADREMTQVQNDWDYNIFSRRIQYDPVARTLRSDHRSLDLVYDEAKGAFVGTIRHPLTRARRYVEVTVPQSALPG